MRGKSSSKRNNTRRHLMIVACLAAFFTLLIVAVSLLRSPDSPLLPEVYAERELLRTDPEQNLLTFIYQGQPAPERPESLQIPADNPENPTLTYDYYVENGSIPWLIGVGRPLEDPLTQQYLRDTRYIVAFLDEASTRPHYINSHMSWFQRPPANYPAPPPPQGDQINAPLSPMWAMQTYFGHLILELQTNPDGKRAREMLHTMYACVTTYAHGTFRRNFRLDGHMDFVLRFRSHARSVHGYMDDPVVRNRFRELVSDLPVPYNDMSKLLTNKIAILDELMQLRHIPDDPDWETRFLLFQANRVHNGLAKVLPELYTLAEAHPRAWDNTLDMRQFLDFTIWKTLNRQVVGEILLELQHAYAANAAHEALPVVLAIDEYILRHGAVPKSLEELVPEFFDAVPLDPYTQQEYLYDTEDGSTYVLTGPRYPIHDLRFQVRDSRLIGEYARFFHNPE